MADCSGVKCATLCVAASTVFSSDATAAEEIVARPRPLPASARKLRRVRSRSMEFEIVIRWEALQRKKQELESRKADQFEKCLPGWSFLKGCPMATGLHLQLMNTYSPFKPALVTVVSTVIGIVSVHALPTKIVTGPDAGSPSQINTYAVNGSF